jgi:1-acyl-sn-glycerol-3-phosphate acyltransferase
MDPWQLRPARDHGLPLRERLASTRREPGLGEVLLQRGTGMLLSGYLRAAHRLRIHGAEQLPSQPPFVMIANHSSHLDALSLAAALPWRLRQDTYLLAAGDVFFETPAKSLLASWLLNALPMQRRGPVRHALGDLRARLQEDHCGLVLFPEGTRSPDGAMQPFKPGLGMLVAGTEVPVLPCWVEGAFAAWPRQAKWPRRGPVQVRIGAPLRFGAVADDREGWQLVVRQAEQAVANLAADLLPPNRCDARGR